MTFSTFFVLAIVNGQTVIIPTPDLEFCKATIINMAVQRIPDTATPGGGVFSIWCIDASIKEPPTNDTPPPTQGESK